MTTTIEVWGHGRWPRYGWRCADCGMKSLAHWRTAGTAMTACERCGAAFGSCELCSAPPEEHPTNGFVVEQAADGCVLCEPCDDIKHGRVETFMDTASFIASLESTP